MIEFNPLRELPCVAGYGEGDVFVLFGELFGRGYANGLVEQARNAGMTILGITVGRRDSDGALRPLNNDELAESEAFLGGKIVNIPLEAGFDLDRDESGHSPVEYLKGVKSDAWERVELDWSAIEQAVKAGRERFAANLELVMEQLDALIPDGRNVVFSHTMAGGVPRARILMPVMNRVFKGQGERFTPSEVFWKSSLGELCRLSFDEVTANTFRCLLSASGRIRERIRATGGRVSYTAYGYHGCEVLINGVYTWQSYTPYLQGWAKMRLEEVASEAWAEGIRATVFNCPEIQTNSSALFLGVELSLYPLLRALEKEGGGRAAEDIMDACRALLKEGVSLEDVLTAADSYLSDPLNAEFRNFGEWPRHNCARQASLMLGFATRILDMNRDQKDIVCAELSRAVFRSVGRLIFDCSWVPSAPVVWLNHDIVARRILVGK